MSDRTVTYVDIIIPTYNRADLVTHAVQSVLNQSFPHVRVLVIDDASTNHTASNLSRFTDDRITVIRAAQNLGVTGAKNLGLDHLPADSTYFGILDSDDTLEPEAIERLLRAFEPGEYSQVLGRCREAGTSRIVSLLDGAPCERLQTIDLRGAMDGRFSGEYWHLAKTDLVQDFRFEARARGGEGLLWHWLLREQPALLLPVDVRTYDTSGADRVSLEAYSRRAAVGKMWVYRAYIDEFGGDLPQGRLNDMLREATKYALLGGDFRYGIQALQRLDLSAAGKLKLLAWPAYAHIRHLLERRNC